MIRSLWTAKTGMEAQQTQLDIIAHNLANVGTNGFKRGHVVFEDLIYQNLRQAGAASSDQTQLPTGLQMGLGVRPVATSRIFTQGNLQQTSQQPRPRDQGAGLLPDPAARRHHRLHARRRVPGRCQRPARHQQRLPGAARHHDSGQRAERDHRARRHGHGGAAGPGHAAAASARSRSPRSSIRPASSPRA